MKRNLPGTIDLSDTPAEFLATAPATFSTTTQETLSLKTRVGSSTPDAYRLGKKPDGTLVLQGVYTWQEGNNYGHEWRDIPTVNLEDENDQTK